MSNNLKSTENEVGVVKISDFLDFLNISFQVTDSITKHNENRSSSINQLDFDQLQHNELITNLLSRANSTTTSGRASPCPTSTTNNKSFSSIDDEKLIDSAANTKKGSLTPKLSNKMKRNLKGSKNSSRVSSNFDRGLDPALQAKLDEVINEGILDSVLPFVCPNVGTNNDCNGHHVVPQAKSQKASNNSAASHQKQTVANEVSQVVEPPMSSKKLNNTPEKQVSITSKAHMRKKNSTQNSLQNNDKNAE